MFSRLLNSTRRLARLFVLSHILLAIFAPTLHAHCVTPADHASGFHMHSDLAFASEVAISGLGNNHPTLTIEVAEQRLLKSSELVADASTLLTPFVAPYSYPNLPSTALLDVPVDGPPRASRDARAVMAAKASIFSCASPPLPQAP